jgi:hypothetical protein
LRDSCYPMDRFATIYRVSGPFAFFHASIPPPIWQVFVSPSLAQFAQPSPTVRRKRNRTQFACPSRWPVRAACRPGRSRRAGSDMVRVVSLGLLHVARTQTSSIPRSGGELRVRVKSQARIFRLFLAGGDHKRDARKLSTCADRRLRPEAPRRTNAAMWRPIR